MIHIFELTEKETISGSVLLFIRKINYTVYFYLGTLHYGFIFLVRILVSFFMTIKRYLNRLETCLFKNSFNQEIQLQGTCNLQFIKDLCSQESDTYLKLK